MQVTLFKLEKKYVDKTTGEEKTSFSFYLQCGDTLIPIEPVYYTKKDKDGKELPDYGYVGRKEVLKAFASQLPAKNEQ